FSSRRRHTRWPRDWSSDVCSSDLCRSSGNSQTGSSVASPGGLGAAQAAQGPEGKPGDEGGGDRERDQYLRRLAGNETACRLEHRSEERRVGKERRTGWGGNVVNNN